MQQKKKKNNVIKNNQILKLLKNNDFSTIIRLTVAICKDSKKCG